MGTNYYNNIKNKYNNRVQTTTTKGTSIITRVNYNYQSSIPELFRPCDCYATETMRTARFYRSFDSYMRNYSYYFMPAMLIHACAETDNQQADICSSSCFPSLTCRFTTVGGDIILSETFTANTPRYGLSFTENGTTILLWLLFGSSPLFHQLVYCNEYHY